MNHSKNTHALEELIADYLNGHLSDTDVQRLNLAITQDSQLREMVEFERSIQSSITAEQATPTYVPQFAGIVDRLDTRSGSLTSRWTTWGGASVAAALLVVVVVDYLPQPEQPINEFETLSNIPTTYDKPVLRIVNKDNLDESALTTLLNDYDLKIIKRYPGTNAIDVISNKSTRLELIAKQLKKDRRVKFTQLKQGQ
jgi:MinD superfamily P-loop ATPase